MNACVRRILVIMCKNRVTLNKSHFPCAAIPGQNASIYKVILALGFLFYRNYFSSYGVTPSLRNYYHDVKELNRVAKAK